MSDRPAITAITEANISQRRGPSLVWLLPLVALVVSSWLIYKSIIDKGPVITVDFTTAEGLEVEKTRFRFRDVEIGKVTKIRINDDLKTIRITASMNKGTEAFFKDNSRMWVVRPQVGLGGVTGLSTLLTGPYIQVEPGEGKKKSHFAGLEKPPALSSEVEGRRFVLQSENVSYIGAGAPIHFHGEQVGKVLERSLSDDGRTVSLAIFIRAPFHQFVRNGTQFWIDSGIDIEAGAEGVNVRTGPLVSLLSGGISFKVPTGASDNEPGEEGMTFHLYDSLKQTAELSYSRTLTYTMHFEGSIRGLKVGAPVELRGIPVGKVTDIQIEIDDKTNNIRIPVQVVLEPERMGQISDNEGVHDREFIDHLIEQGLRGQLQTGSLITGQLFVALDFYPHMPLYRVASNQDELELPTIPPTLDQFADSAKSLMDRLSNLPLDDLTTEITESLAAVRKTTEFANDMLSSTRNTMDTATTTLADIKTTLNNTFHAADKTLNSVDVAIASIQATLDTADGTLVKAGDTFSTFDKGSSIHYELQQALKELADAARSMRELARYLQRNPDSLLRGKPD